MNIEDAFLRDYGIIPPTRRIGFKGAVPWQDIPRHPRWIPGTKEHKEALEIFAEHKGYE